MPCYRAEAAMSRAKGWRKIATATWGWPEDPQVYGRHEFDATPILEAVEVLRERTGARVTPTHLLVRALALGFRENPSLNTRLARGRFLPRESVDIFVIVASGVGGDLSGVKIRRADEKSAAEIERRPWAVGDEVKVRPVLPVTATIDHRWVDGYGIAGLAETIRKYLANPLASEE
jgi:pyruvate/2-oxoglutarate dehydrogenase complex dihydrolipoamide acyltransferase (E2) component